MHVSHAQHVHAMQDWEEGDGKYVAPELLNGQVEPTPAADIYSLGATLYECATGEHCCHCSLAGALLIVKPPAVGIALLIRIH